MTFKGLSLNLTVGLPFALTALQTSENGTKLSLLIKPRKSFVSKVPQPKDTLALCENKLCSLDIVSTSRPSEKIINLSFGFSPHFFHH